MHVARTRPSRNSLMTIKMSILPGNGIQSVLVIHLTEAQVLQDFQGLVNEDVVKIDRKYSPSTVPIKL